MLIQVLSDLHLETESFEAQPAPGADVLSVLEPPAPGEPDTEREHYTAVLARLAVPYAVDSQRRVFVSQYSATTLTPSTGLITSVHDYAQFDLALRGGGGQCAAQQQGGAQAGPQGGRGLHRSVSQ